jgi:hypothetical protein
VQGGGLGCHRYYQLIQKNGDQGKPILTTTGLLMEGDSVTYTPAGVNKCNGDLSPIEPMCAHLLA